MPKVTTNYGLILSGYNDQEHREDDFNLTTIDTALASSSGGGITGSGTDGFLPEFSGTSVVQDSPIDDGNTSSGVITVNGTGVGVDSSGIYLVGGSYGIWIDTVANDFFEGSANGAIRLLGGTSISLNANTSGAFQVADGLALTDSGANLTIQETGPGGISIADSSGGIVIQESGEGGISIEDEDGSVQISESGTGGINFNDYGGGGISLNSVSGLVITPGITMPNTVYSASGTPLPDADEFSQGTTAVVGDALNPTFYGPYTSGGAATVMVITDGNNNWYTI